MVEQKGSRRSAVCVECHQMFFYFNSGGPHRKRCDKHTEEHEKKMNKARQARYRANYQAPSIDQIPKAKWTPKFHIKKNGRYTWCGIPLTKLTVVLSSSGPGDDDLVQGACVTCFNNWMTETRSGADHD